MATEAQLLEGLRQADAAGNAADAQHFADAIKAQRAVAQPSPEQPNPVMDAVRAIPGGLAKGVTGIVGLPSTAVNMAGNLGRKLTGQEEIPDNDPRASTFMGIPTVGQANDAVSKPFGGFYQPKTVAGDYAQTAAEFAPNALAPGSAAARVARVLVPAATSETAGQVTKGTKAEPYARALGGLVGGVGEGLGEGAIANAGKPPAPTLEELHSQANALYDTAKNSGVAIKPEAYDDLANQVKAAVTDAGTHPKLHPKIAGVLESLDDARGTAPSLGDMERLRRIAKGAASSIEPDERRVAGVVLDKLDDFVGNLKPDQVASGDASAANSLGAARDTWSRMRKSETIENAVERAQNAAESNRGNLAAALRSQFKSLANNRKAMRGFSPDEQDAIKALSRTDVLTGSLATAGAFRPRGVIGALEVIGGVANHEVAPFAMAAALGGEGAQRSLNALTLGKAARLSAGLRAGAVPAAAESGNSAALLGSLLLSRQGGH